MVAVGGPFQLDLSLGASGCVCFFSRKRTPPPPPPGCWILKGKIEIHAFFEGFSRLRRTGAGLILREQNKKQQSMGSVWWQA